MLAAKFKQDFEACCKDNKFKNTDDLNQEGMLTMLNALGFVHSADMQVMQSTVDLFLMLSEN